MGLWDSVFRLGADSNDKLSVRNSGLSVIESAIAERKLKNNIIYRFSAEKLATLAMPVLGTKVSSNSVSEGPLYAPVNMNLLDKLKTTKDGKYYYGAFISNEGKSTMTKWKMMSSTKSNVGLVPVDPVLLAVAAIIVELNKKLEHIENSCERIESLLAIEKESEILGDLRTVIDVMKGYAYNLSNDMYLHSNHKLALDIRRTSEKNFHFCQEKISADIKHLPKLTTDSKFRNFLDSMYKSFVNYNATLRIYSIASLLDVLLLGDVNRSYFEDAKSRIIERESIYLRDYGSVLDLINKSADNTVQSTALKGFTNAEGALGHIIGVIPIVRKGPIDELLIYNSHRIREWDKGRKNAYVDNFETIGKTDASSISSCIETIEALQFDANSVIIQNGIINVIK